MIKIAARCALLSLIALATACAQLPGEMTASDGTLKSQLPAQDPIAKMAAQAAPVNAPAPAFAAPEPQVKAPPKDVWERVRSGYTMKPMDTELVRHWENFYSAKPEYFARMVDRSSHYLFHIIEEIERRKMPAEVALLPMIESAYNPQAYSKAHASGLWQFIPSTGRMYGLRQNWWYDGRRDVIAATSAALDYLEKLYGMFGDWELALASYNWGEGAVGRAVAKNRAKGLPTDYLHLKMPAETAYYVPKLQAIKNIIAQPQLFGITLDPIPNRPYFGTVERSEKMDIALAARLAEIPVDEFIALNPAYSRPVMPMAANSPLVLPAEKVQTFLDNLQNHEAQDKPLSAWLTHNLKKGEKLETVAARYGISAARLKQLNGINARTKITPGFALLVPGKDAIGHEALAARLPQTPDKPPRATKWKKGKAKAKPKGINAKIRKSPTAKPAVKPKKH